MSLVQQVAEQELPRSMAYDWTELSYLQLQAGNTTLVAFGLAVVFVFLALAARRLHCMNSSAGNGGAL